MGATLDKNISLHCKTAITKWNACYRINHYFTGIRKKTYFVKSIYLLLSYVPTALSLSHLLSNLLTAPSVVSVQSSFNKTGQRFINSLIEVYKWLNRYGLWLKFLYLEEMCASVICIISFFSSLTTEWLQGLVWILLGNSVRSYQVISKYIKHFKRFERI